MKQTRMKYVVAIPKSVLLVATILTLALFTSIYPIIIPWKPVFASPDTSEDYVDIQSDVDSVIDKGTHSNFTAQMYGPDSTYDTLTEENTGGGNQFDDYIDQTSNVDGIINLGSQSNFNNMRASDSAYNLLSEQDVSEGTSWWFYRTDEQQSGTDISYVECATLDFTAPAQGNYLIMVNSGVSGSSTTTGVRVRSQLDNSVTLSEAEVQVGSTSPQGFKPYAAIYLAQSLASGDHYVDLDVYKVTSGTWYIDYAHITVLRLDDWMPTANMYAYTQTTTASNIGTGVANAFQTQATLTFTPDQAGDYIVIAMIQLCPASTSASALTRLNFDSGTRYIPLSNTEESATNPLVFEGRTVTDQNSWVWGSIVTLTAASHTFLLETGMSSTATGANGAANKRILAMRIGAMDSSAHTTDDTSVTSTSSQYETKVSIQFTPSDSRDYLIFGGLSNKPDTTSAPTGTRFIQSEGDDISTVGLVQHDSKDSSTPADCFPFFASSVRSLSQQQQTFEIQYGHGMGTSGVAYGKGSFIVVIAKPSGPTPDYQLDLEVQFVDVAYFVPNQYLCIETGTFSGSEDLNVTYWTGSVWSSIASDMTASQWNNFSVSITSETFTIKFGGSTTSSDTVQDTWNIDTVCLQLSGEGSAEFIVDNEDSDVDSSIDHGTITDFANMQDYPSNYATVAEGRLPKIEGFNFTAGSVAGEQSLVLTAPSGITAGELLVLIVMSDDNAAGPYFNAITDWTKHAEAGSGTADAKIALYYKEATGLEGDVTITTTSLDNNIGWYIRISGVDFTDKIEASNFAESTATGTNPHVIPAITTVNNNCLALYGLAFDGGDGNPMSVDGTWLELDDQTIDGTSATEGGSWGMKNMPTAGSTVAASVTTGIQTDGAAYFQIAFNSGLNYTLDQEIQFTNVNYRLEVEYLCIATGTTGTEDILVDIWNGTGWENLFSDLTASSWNNVSIGAYLDSKTFTIRFRDGNPTSDTTTQDSWQINIALIYVENTGGGGDNYELELEEQFTNANYTRTNEELCIYMGTFNAGGETLSVQWWNDTDSSWLTIISSLSTSQWNNVSVTDYLTSATFTIRFIDGTKTSDSSQGTWQKDACLLHTWTLGYNLNLRVMDLDLTDNIQGAYVYKDSDVKTSDAEGWANWTLVSGTVEIKVQYFGFWVNGTFSVTMDSDKTIDVQCKLYDVTVLVQESVQNAYLVSANVTVYNSTSVQDNKITSGVTGNNGQVQLLNLPNNTLTFTQYGGASYSLVIGNTTRLVSSENQTITLTADQNNINTNNSYSIIAFAGMTIPLKGSFATGRLKKKRRNK